MAKRENLGKYYPAVDAWDRLGPVSPTETPSHIVKVTIPLVLTQKQKEQGMIGMTVKRFTVSMKKGEVGYQESIRDMLVGCSKEILVEKTRRNGYSDDERRKDYMNIEEKETIYFDSQDIKYEDLSDENKALLLESCREKVSEMIEEYESYIAENKKRAVTVVLEMFHEQALSLLSRSTGPSRQIFYGLLNEVEQKDLIPQGLGDISVETQKETYEFASQVAQLLGREVPEDPQNEDEESNLEDSIAPQEDRSDEGSENELENTPASSQSLEGLLQKFGK